MAFEPPAAAFDSALELDRSKALRDARDIDRGHRPELTGIDTVFDASPMISRQRSTARRSTTSSSNAVRPRATIAAISSAAITMSATRWTSARLTA